VDQAVGDVALAGVAAGYAVAALVAEGVGDGLYAFAFDVLAVWSVAECAFDFAARVDEGDDVALGVV
jgi:hypothetical protein